MAFTSQTAQSLLDPTAKRPGNVRSHAIALRQRGPLGGDVAEAINNIQGQLDVHDGALRAPLPLPDEFQIVDATGQVIGWVGHYTDPATGILYQGGYFHSLYVGGSSPANAVFTVSSGGGVFINNQAIELKSLNGDIILSPIGPQIKAQTLGFSPNNTQFLVNNGVIEEHFVNDVGTPTSSQRSTMSPNAILLYDPSNNSVINLDGGSGTISCTAVNTTILNLHSGGADIRMDSTGLVTVRTIGASPNNEVSINGGTLQGHIVNDAGTIIQNQSYQLSPSFLGMWDGTNTQSLSLDGLTGAIACKLLKVQGLNGLSGGVQISSPTGTHTMTFTSGLLTGVV
jgi:hypothetical protein